MKVPVHLLETFDDVRYEDLRRVERAARDGSVRVLMPSDRRIVETTGREPRFPLAERAYLAEAVRWVEVVVAFDDPGELDAEALAQAEALARAEALAQAEVGGAGEAGAEARGESGPPEAVADRPIPRPIVLVTGCYDWLHSGHVRFFEEAATHGNLVVTVGSDASVAAFKGTGHPVFPQQVRRYMVGAVRHVHRSVVASGSGWLDAAPEIEQLRPDVWIVNEDGDRSEKRDFCAARGIEYRVLRRAPRPGLPARSSTELRGF